MEPAKVLFKHACPVSFPEIFTVARLMVGGTSYYPYSGLLMDLEDSSQ